MRTLWFDEQRGERCRTREARPAGREPATSGEKIKAHIVSYDELYQLDLPQPIDDVFCAGYAPAFGATARGTSMTSRRTRAKRVPSRLGSRSGSRTCSQSSSAMPKKRGWSPWPTTGTRGKPCNRRGRVVITRAALLCCAVLRVTPILAEKNVVRRREKT
jgi:hypothetical protein